MIQIAEELVEAVDRRQEFVAVAEMILAKLAGGVPVVLEQLRDGRVFGLQALCGARNADLAQPRAIHALASDKCGPTGRTALLPV